MLATDGVKATDLRQPGSSKRTARRPFKLLNPLHHNVFFQLEAGDAIGQQPARAVIAVIDRHLHALPAQHVRRGQAPRAPRQ